MTEYFGPRITQPAFPSLFSSAFEHPLRSNNSKSVQVQTRNISIIVTNFCRYLRLNRSQEVVLRIALLENLGSDARSQFLLIVRQKLTELFKNFTDQDRSTVPLEGGIQVAPIKPYFQ